MLKEVFIFLILLFCAQLSRAQLSKGQGEMITLPQSKIRCYLPAHFKVRENPLGVFHNTSGTFVIIKKVPAGQSVTVEDGLARSFFEDDGYTLLSLREEDITAYNIQSGRLYYMRYAIDGHEFERYTLLFRHGHAHYLVIGNYVVKLKEQVEEEVKKIMTSFIMH